MLCKFKINVGNVFIANTNLGFINVVNNDGNYPVAFKKHKGEEKRWIIAEDKCKYLSNTLAESETFFHPVAQRWDVENKRKFSREFLTPTHSNRCTQYQTKQKGWDWREYLFALSPFSRNE